MDSGRRLARLMPRRHRRGQTFEPYRVLPQHFKSDGSAKRRWTRGEAENQATRHGPGWTAYHCTFCDGWHVGGPPKQ
jgi:hypothetical protein